MKIIFAHEILDYNKITKYNLFYLDYHLYDKITNLITNMNFFSYKIENLFQNILINKYNIDINKIIIIDLEFPKMKDEFKKIFPNFKYLNSITEKETKHRFIDVNPGNYIIFNKIFNINIDHIYCIKYNSKNIIENEENEEKILDKFDKLDRCPFRLFFTENDDFLYNQNECIKDAKYNKYTNIIIFDFKNDLFFDMKIIQKMIRNNYINIPDDFNICHLSYNIDNTKESYRYDKYIISMKKIISSVALILNNSSYDTLLNHYDNSININSVNIYNDLKSYGVFPIICDFVGFKNDLIYSYLHNKKKFISLMINLERRKDRLQKFNFLYADEFPNITIINAIDGKSHDFSKQIELFDLKKYPIKQKNSFGNHGYKGGVLGCALSHFNLWNKLSNDTLSKEDDFILILEDDITLCNDFNIKINNLLDDLCKDSKWGLVFLGFTDYKNYRDIKISDKLIQFSDNPRNRGGGTFGYFIRKKAAIKLIQNASKYKIQQAIDWFMIEQFDDIISYKCEPELIFSNALYLSNDSDIQ